MRGWRKPPTRKRTTGIEPATLSLGSEGEPGSAGSGGHLLVEESHFPALGGCFDFPLVPVRTCQLVANQAHRGLHRLPHGLVRAHAVEQMHVLPLGHAGVGVPHALRPGQVRKGYARPPRHARWLAETCPRSPGRLAARRLGVALVVGDAA